MAGSSSASSAMTMTESPPMPSPFLSRSLSFSPPGSPASRRRRSPVLKENLVPTITTDAVAVAAAPASPDVMLRGKKKTRPAPLPPGWSSPFLQPIPSTSPHHKQRHSDILDLKHSFRTSTDSDSTASEAAMATLYYQTSTDSGELIPESALGSNFPGELAGVDRLSRKLHRSRMMNQEEGYSGSFRSPVRSRNLPRDKSALLRLRDAFRSPQVPRKRSKKGKNKQSKNGSGSNSSIAGGSGGVEGNESQTDSPRISRLLVDDDDVIDSPRISKRKAEDARKSPKPRKRGEHDPGLEMSDWIIPHGHDEIGVDHEFEVKRIPDYARYLNDLLEETDAAHPDFEDLSKAAGRVTSMVREREKSLCESDHLSAMEDVQGRFPHDDLQLYHRKSDSSSGSIIATATTTTSPPTKDAKKADQTDNGSSDVGVVGATSVTTTSDSTMASAAAASVDVLNDSSSSNISSRVKPSPLADNHNENSNQADLATASEVIKIGKNDVVRTVVKSAEDIDMRLSKVKVTASSRRRSAPSAVLFKSLSGSKSRNSGSLWSNAGMGKKDHDVISSLKVTDTDSSRMFIMEGPVQLATGMQIQERYLFLFSDLLLIAKQKSSTAFKLKQRVQLSDMWIASCIEEVSETTRPAERSFVLGWPMTNVVATFPTDQGKADWLHKLAERITEEKLKDEGKTLQLKVSPRDVETASGQTCQMTINNVTQAKDVLQTCLKQLSITENELSNYQLWVISGKEGSPYPLIGHETPFAIKLSQVREVSRSRSRDDVTNMTSGDLDTVIEESAAAGQKCEFYVKHKKTPKKHHIDDSSYQKPMKKPKKSPNIISNFFRKIRSPHPLVFGLPLSDICDENFDPPEPIIRLMVLVYLQGPSVPGILRRGNKASLAKEIREKIDSGVRYSVEDHQAPTAASVFKEFLRSVPGGLLVSELHNQWVAVSKEDLPQAKLEKIKSILDQLPPANYRLVKLTISLLQHLAKFSDHTNMGPSNLATCIAPSFCSPSSPAGNGVDFHNGKGSHSNSPVSGSSSSSAATTLLQVQNSVHEITNVFTPLITFMIVKHIELFGDDILDMFVKHGCEASPPVSLEEMGEEGGGNAGGEGAEEDEEDEQDKMGDQGSRDRTVTSVVSGRHRDSSIGDEVDDEDEDEDDDEMMAEEEDDDEEEEEYRGIDGYGSHHLHRHHKSHMSKQIHSERQRTQPSSGPRDSNSGTDSDSMHSVLSMPDTGSGMGYRRDDSSLDSLVEREYYQQEDPGSTSPQAHKSHLSPSNLSRDSGLTLSDTQLYDEDVGSTSYPSDPSRNYQRSMSTYYDPQHPHHQHIHSTDDWLSRSMMDPRALERHGDPIATPRIGREYKKKSRESSEGSDGESGPYHRSRPPFKHSSSSPMMDVQSRAGMGGAELKACLTHPPVGKRVSADSIGEEDEGNYDDHQAYRRLYHGGHAHGPSPQNSIDFQHIRQHSDMGTIIKSESGTHLYLRDDATCYSLSGPEMEKSQQQQQSHGRFYLRQTSLTDSTGSPDRPTPPTSPPVKTTIQDESSPLPKYVSNSATRHGNQWEPSMNSAYRECDFNARSLSLAYSKSTSDLLAQHYSDEESHEDVEEQDKTLTADNSMSSTNSSKLVRTPEVASPQTPPKYVPPPSPKLWSGRKSHEAEEVVDMRRRPHFSLMQSTNQPPPYRKQSLGLPPQHLIKGSPPPNVILQSLSVPKKEATSPSSTLPMRASYDSAILSQVRRTSATDLDFAKSMNSIHPEEYVSVTPKSIIIPSPKDTISTSAPLSSPNSVSSSSLPGSSRTSLSPISSASARRAKLAKYMNSLADTDYSPERSADGVQRRPEKPPNYQQALQRNFMLKHSVPLDITDDDTELQRERNAKAKALYEKSLQIYHEQRLNRSKGDGAPSLNTTKGDSNQSDAASVIERDNNYNQKSVRSAMVYKAADNRLKPHNSQLASNESYRPGDSEFLDLGSISDSLQEDVLTLRDKFQPKVGAMSASDYSIESNRPSLPLSRNDSRLSDLSVGSSSGGSTITISTLSRQSDTSSIASSVTTTTTSNDSGGESPIKSDQELRKLSYSRHWRTRDPDEDAQNSERGEAEWSTEGDGVYVTLKKKPQELYLESMKMYEEKAAPSSISQPSKQSPNPPSSIKQSSAESKPSRSSTAQTQNTHHPHPSHSSQQTVRSSFETRDFPPSRTTHEVPSVQRSQSDASKSASLADRFGPKSKTAHNTVTLTEHRTSDDQQQQQQQQSSNQFVPSMSASASSYPSDITPEHHENFLKARSCFFKPEQDNVRHQSKPSYKVITNTRRGKTPTTSAALSMPSSVSTSNLSTMNFKDRLDPSLLVEDMSVESGHSPRSKQFVPLKSKPMYNSTLCLPSSSSSSSSILSRAPSSSTSSSIPTSKVSSGNNNSNVSKNQGKNELPWSVKSLKSLYDKDSVEKSQPPPYKEPPPFKRQQGPVRASASSSGSDSSEVAAGSAVNRRSALLSRSGGPQTSTLEALHAYSSSDDSYCSSHDWQHLTSLDSSQEAISDHTNITYV